VLQKVTVGHWSLDAYDGIAPEPIMQELREHARALEGARILNVNATSYGGGVSELLRSSIPLLRDRRCDSSTGSIAVFSPNGYGVFAYQPQSRFWAFQFIEGGWLLVLAVILGAATIWLVRRRAA